MKYILLFLINYLIVLGIYELFIVKKAKKDKRKKPIEVKLLVNKFGIDLKKRDFICLRNAAKGIILIR